MEQRMIRSTDKSSAILVTRQVHAVRSLYRNLCLSAESRDGRQVTGMDQRPLLMHFGMAVSSLRLVVLVIVSNNFIN